MPFFLPQDPLQDTILHSLYLSAILQFSLSFVTLTPLKSSTSLFCRMSLNLHWLLVPHDWSNAAHFLQDCHKDDVLMVSHQEVHNVHIYMSCYWWCLLWLSSWTPDSYTREITFFSSVLIKYLGKDTLKPCKSCFSSKFHPGILAFKGRFVCSIFYWGTCLRVILYFPPSTFTHWYYEEDLSLSSHIFDHLY